MKKKNQNLTTREGDECCQVEIKVLEHDMSEKKGGGGGGLDGWGTAPIWCRRGTCAAPWSAAHSI